VGGLLELANDLHPALVHCCAGLGAAPSADPSLNEAGWVAAAAVVFQGSPAGAASESQGNHQREDFLDDLLALAGPRHPRRVRLNALRWAADLVAWDPHPSPRGVGLLAGVGKTIEEEDARRVVRWVVESPQFQEVLNAMAEALPSHVAEATPRADGRNGKRGQSELFLPSAYRIATAIATSPLFEGHAARQNPAPVVKLILSWTKGWEKHPLVKISGPPHRAAAPREPSRISSRADSAILNI